MTPSQQERENLVNQASDAIVDTMRQFPFGISLMAGVMGMVCMFRVMDDLNPPPEVKSAYVELQRELELFVARGYLPFLQAGLANGEDLN